MHILYLAQLVPYPADAGPKVRMYHVLQYLAHAGHQITLVAFERTTDSAAALEHLQGLCTAVYTVPMRRATTKDVKHLVRSLVTGQPFLIGRDFVPEMETLITTLLQQQTFDAIHADQLWMAQYALAARQRTQTAAQIVLDQHNAVYLIPQRLAARANNPLKKLLLNFESKKLARYEMESCAKFDRVVWVTDEDRAAITHIANGHAHAISGPTIPICVDPETKGVIERQPHGRRVTFLGGLHWPPNAEGMIWFAREVWPQIIAAVPDAQLTIIGKDPPAELQQLSFATRNINITGYVADLHPFLEETAVFIVPLHSGGGMRVKIIDGWSWGLPIVSTTIGAEGIQYDHGRNIVIADDAVTFAQAVSGLMHNSQQAANIAQAGRHTVETLYNWRVTYQNWDKIYATANR